LALVIALGAAAPIVEAKTDAHECGGYAYYNAAVGQCVTRYGGHEGGGR
jgi:hypothetical protein